MRSISTKALFSTLFFLLTCLIANSATHNITRRSSRDRSHRKKCPISSSPLQCSHQIIPPTPTAPPPDLPNPEQLLSFADQRLQMVYPIIQKFKSIITSDPRNITKTWVGSDICNYRGFYCDNPPYNSSAIALASIDFNGFQLGASSLDGFLDQLPDIALFHANSNNFSGTISSKIASLPYLYEFDISNNQFSGPFPTALLGMNSLTFLDVRFNFFTGSVPPQIFTQDLDALFLNNNDFMASLPDNLGSSHIVLLTLANNKFNGPIPRSIAKALSSLTEVLLLNNQLTGCLPYEIGLLKEAIVFDASNNQLTGPLPFSLACLDKVEQLNFAGNLLFGMVPEVICDQLENLAYFSLSDNYFIHVGPICQSLIQRGVIDVSNNCIPGLPFQRSVEECAYFFAHPRFCSYMESYTYIPCITCSPVNSSSLPPSDALALLAFRSKSDLSDSLPFSSNTSLHFCQWAGVQCAKSKVVRLVIQGLDLAGIFAPDTLTRLDQLRVLTLQNNSLTGPIPDLSGLINLKTLFLDHNSFSGSLPPSLSTLHRLRTLDFSYNNLTGPLPTWLTGLNRLYYLRLEWNRFNGTVPALNQSSLQTFNVSGNNLTGVVPLTPTLLRFGPTSFSWNPGLCGEIIHIECHPNAPFFSPATPTPAELAPSPTRALGLRTEQGVELTQPCHKKHKRTAVTIGFSSGVFVLICSLLCFALALKKQRRQVKKTDMTSDDVAAAQAAAAVQIEQEELEQKVKRVQGIQVVKSGSLLFCAGEVQVYSLEQLMRASAELLGRGTMGSTYKAVLDNRLIVCVKRLDASVLEGTGREEFERHLESVGGLRHPNLVPLRAYFQANQERLLIYDYQPNGTLFSLIHDSKSTRAKPLHWTSCLKIAEDVAQGLSYIHQAWRLVHGNLKSSNVLLGSDFEACVTDYCLSVLATNPPQWEENPDSAAYKAPETRHSNHPQTPKSDVYAYGILLVELLTGRPPSQHLVSAPPSDMMEWARSMREESDPDVGSEDSENSSNKMGMLLEVAIACSSASPEQRPTMWQVLKQLQEIKETVSMPEAETELMGSCPGG